MKAKLTSFLKYCLFGLIMTTLFIPMTEHYFNHYEVVPLNGAFAKSEKPKLALASWWDRSFQVKSENYCNENFGFRNKFVRMYNQAAFSIFNKTNAKNIVIGKNGVLFEKVYVDSYLGLDYIGKDKIDEQLFKLEKVRDTLKKLNKELILVFAPGKAVYSPEYLPEYIDVENSTMTNYKAFSEKLNNSRVNFIDCQKWFLEQKSSSKYPLFPKTGVHWSVYGSYLATDSIIHYMDSLRDFQMSKFSYEVNLTSSQPLYSDDDLEKILNLKYNILDFPNMAYPTYNIEVTTASIQPKVMVVADSFWSVFGFSLMKKMFGDGAFWFYGDQIYKVDSETVETSDSVNVQQEVESNDIVLILQTDSNLKDIGFGLIDKLYAIYYPD